WCRAQIRCMVLGKWREPQCSTGDTAVSTDLMVVGLGYVGLPLAREATRAGMSVVGFDISTSAVRTLNSGRSHIDDVTDEDVAYMLKAGFRATEDESSVGPVEVAVICVPTPLREGSGPDLTAVIAAAGSVGRLLRPGGLVVLESTTYPGTTDEVIRPILERGGLRVGRDVHLAFSPEREDPNNHAFTTRTIPKLVGGITPECGRVATALYSAVIERVIPVSSAAVAEAAKLLENIYRSVNIALVNELKVLFDRMGLNVWEVIDAA